MIFWLDYITERLQDNNDMQAVNHYINLVDQVKAGELKDIANKYLSGDNYIRAGFAAGKYN